jgi:hypothetical protein
MYYDMTDWIESREIGKIRARRPGRIQKEGKSPVLFFFLMFNAGQIGYVKDIRHAQIKRLNPRTS